jgi:anti-sigma factor RsiW
MHLDDESLERLLHGELDPGLVSTARSHLASCPSCEARLEESRALESRLFGLLGTLDHEAPGIDWNSALNPPSTRARAGSRIAASIAFLLLAGGILYALPDSPVRGWIDRLRGMDATEAPTPGIGSRSEIETPVSGLRVRPAGAFEIDFEDSQAIGAIRLRLVRTPEVEIRVLGSPVRLESGTDRVSVSNANSQSSYEILVPESAASIRLRVDGKEVFLTQWGEVQSAGLPDSTGFYVLDLGGSRR